MAKAISPMFPALSRNKQQKIDNLSILLQEKPLLGYVNLRMNIADKALSNAVTTTLGQELPKINQVSKQDKYTVVGLSPTEWLIVCDNASDLIKGLNTGLADAHALVTDVSGGYTQISVVGEVALDLLSHGTTVDLHPSVFHIGNAYTTLLAKAPVTLLKQKDSVDIICRRSFSDHLARWLLEVGKEYDIQVNV